MSGLVGGCGGFGSLVLSGAALLPSATSWGCGAVGIVGPTNALPSLGAGGGPGVRAWWPPGTEVDSAPPPRR